MFNVDFVLPVDIWPVLLALMSRMSGEVPVVPVKPCSVNMYFVNLMTHGPFTSNRRVQGKLSVASSSQIQIEKKHVVRRWACVQRKPQRPSAPSI